jgi:hypothetical protein
MEKQASHEPRSEKLEILLPNRIGDAIMSLPAILCLKQLTEKYDQNKFQISLYPPTRLFEIVWSLDLFETKKLDEIQIFKSWINPSDRTIVLDSSSRHIGIRTKKSYGEIIPTKWSARFSVDLPYLDLDKTEAKLPKELINFLGNEYKLSLAIIRYFGLCLEMGFTTAQIIETFRLQKDFLEVMKRGLDDDAPVKWLPWEPTLAKGSYLIFCMEAAYGTKREEKRRWQENNFIDLADKIYEEYKLLSVFIGTDKEVKLPKKEYLVDMRQRLSLFQVAQLMEFSKAYIGNDTGPLHLANLIQIPSLCIYLSTEPQTYGPIFADLNFPLINPKSLDESIDAADNFLRKIS